MYFRWAIRTFDNFKSVAYSLYNKNYWNNYYVQFKAHCMHDFCCYIAYMLM